MLVLAGFVFQTVATGTSVRVRSGGAVAGRCCRCLALMPSSTCTGEGGVSRCVSFLRRLRKIELGGSLVHTSDGFAAALASASSSLLGDHDFGDPAKTSATAPWV